MICFEEISLRGGEAGAEGAPGLHRASCGGGGGAMKRAACQVETAAVNETSPTGSQALCLFEKLNYFVDHLIKVFQLTK